MDTLSSILLVHPPAASPAMPSWECARIAQQLAGPERRITVYDANLDFFRQSCSNRTWIEGCLETARRRAIDRSPDRAPFPDLRPPIDADAAFERLDRLPSVPAGLSPAGDDPLSLAWAFDTIRDTLRLVSLACFPAVLQWGRAAFPTLRTLPAVHEFCNDAAANPFLQVCGLKLRQLARQPGMRLAIVTVAQPDQAIAGWSMAHALKTDSPDLRVVLSGRPELIEGAPVGIDRILDRADDTTLASVAAEATETAGTDDSDVPDFSGFPLSDYPIARRTLPMAFADNPAAEGDAYRRLARRYGARQVILASESDGDRFLRRAAGTAGEAGPAPDVSLPIGWPAAVPIDRFAPAAEAGLRQIRWHRIAAAIDDGREALREAARCGIWNHVVVTGEEARRVPDLDGMMAADPILIHSWSVVEMLDPAWAGSISRRPQRTDGYRDVTPLPGRPLWWHIPAPEYLLGAAAGLPLKRATRRRVVGSPPAVATLGERLRYHFVPPADLPEGGLDDICRMVGAGGSVDTRWVRHNLERAFLIAYAEELGVIVANSSLKHPRPEYVERLKDQAGVDVSHYLERGYTSVRPEYRGLGIGTRLLEGLTRRAGDRKIFSVISEDNLATQKIAVRNRTRKVATFYSDRLGKAVGIWMPEWMIDP